MAVVARNDPTARLGAEALHPADLIVCHIVIHVHPDHSPPQVVRYHLRRCRQVGERDNPGSDNPGSALEPALRG